jgi:hypothetical protein
MSVSSPHHHAPAKQPLLSDRNYTALKKSATIILPALSALYFALSQIWGLPHTEQVMGTIAALNTFLGGVVHVSKKSYYASGAQYAGKLVRTETPDKVLYSLELNHDTPTLDQMDEATFKVEDTGGTPTVNP